MDLTVEVIYALPLRQERVSLQLPPGSTALDAVRASGLLRLVAQGDLGRVGVWGRLVTPETRLHGGDRVEIYRPLLADPKEIRRKKIQP
jgi:putative ubiquitin-RnfH superfamily antitoxin RatB of RatAB toxin-antitoxin module